MIIPSIPRLIRPMMCNSPAAEVVKDQDLTAFLKREKLQAA